MTPKISCVIAVYGAALVFAIPAFGDSWGSDRNQEAIHTSPDLVDRAIAARQKALSSMLDARERSFAAKSAATTIVTPDPVRDDRFRLDSPSVPTVATTTGAASNVEWLQVGIGFGSGALLVLALIAAVQRTRIRQPAH